MGSTGKWLHFTAVAIRDANSKPLGAVETLEDITDRKQAEESLLRTQEQLRQASKMEAIGCLAGGVAHDFNNQLTVVRCYCDLLLKQIPMGSNLRSPVEEISRAAERSAALTSQLLAFSRKQVLQPRNVDLQTVLSALEAPLSRIIGEDMRLTVSIPDGLWQVKVDANQLQQAVINLVVNARDAMPNGGNLTIEAANIVLDPEYVLSHLDSSAGSYVVLSVSDTGIGMDAEACSRVFEPFYTTKAMGRGTGLGLSMVYGFVTQSNGHIEVYSELGLGTCFKVYLPATGGSPRVEEPPLRDAVHRGRECILVVEDDDAVRHLMVHILKMQGYHVLEASNAQAALAVSVARKGTIDLLVSDIVMPGMRGPELNRILSGARPGLKTLYVTGYAEHAAVRDGLLEAGAYLLTKPFASEHFVRVIRQILDNKTVRITP